mmetsp:Transcript_26682/g.45414  ORF Transcript_26682/g.45414 Transcript_26682/m.45414 type:complete len:162 (-) Transcript_26682:78-563(-)
MAARNRYLSITLMHYSMETSLVWQMVTTSLECNSKKSILAILKTVTGRRFVGKNSLDVKIRLQNEAGDGHFVRKLVTVKDGKIATPMEYTATLSSLYVQESSTKLTVPATRPKYYHSGSTIVECTVASDRTTDQRDQMRRFFIEKNAAARRAFHNLIGDMQ